MCMGEVEGGEGLLKTSGMETFLPVVGATTDGSMILLSVTELVRESKRSFTPEFCLQYSTDHGDKRW